MTQKPFFTIIPYNVRNDNRLSSSEKLFFGDLMGLARNEGYVFGSNENLAFTFNISTRQLRDWLLKLETLGYIKRVHTHLGRKIYVTEALKSMSEETQKKQEGGGGGKPPGVGGKPPHINISIEEEETPKAKEELSKEERGILKKNQTFLKEHQLPFKLQRNLQLLRKYGSHNFKQAFNETVGDWFVNHKKIRNFQAVFESKLLALRKDQEEFPDF